MLRNAYVPYFYLKRIREQEAIGFERDLAGLPKATVPAEFMMKNASDAQKSFVTGLAKVVQEVRRNKREGIVFPAQYDQNGNKIMDFELLSSGGQRQLDPDKAIQRYKQEIAMSLLADFLTLGHEGVGSFALGTAKMDLWTLVVSSLAKSVANVVNKHAIEKLLRINGIPYTNAPKLAFGTVSNVDLSQLAQYINSLVVGGLITPDPTLEAWLREAMGAPAAEEQ
jgi:phage gp29-like protein